MSAGHNDEADLARWHLRRDEQDRLIERFKDPDDGLAILVVCDMLLTGFDAPVEQVMYLDAPLKGRSPLRGLLRAEKGRMTGSTGNSRDRAGNSGISWDLMGFGGIGRYCPEWGRPSRPPWTSLRRGAQGGYLPGFPGRISRHFQRLSSRPSPAATRSNRTSHSIRAGNNVPLSADRCG